MTTNSPALACVPDAIPAAERPAHVALVAHLFGEAARERREIPGGYAYRFEPAALEQIARFAASERKCCPFLTFAIELGPDESALWLRLTGPAGTPELLRAELHA